MNGIAKEKHAFLPRNSSPRLSACSGSNEPEQCRSHWEPVRRSAAAFESDVALVDGQADHHRAGDDGNDPRSSHRPSSPATPIALERDAN